MADNQENRDDGIDDGKLETIDREEAEVEVPLQPSNVPRNGNLKDENNPCDHRSDDGGDDGGERDEPALGCNDEVGDSGGKDFNPRRKDIQPNEAGNRFPAFEVDVQRPAMAECGG